MMIKLSDRLQLIADKIQQGETMADIGTDHGFLPLYLMEQGISPKVIMCDISAPSLQKARDAAHDADIKDGTYFREGNGLDVIETGEVDAVVIAGMGGILITEILGADLDKTYSLKKYILQPRNHAEYLRYWLDQNGFEICENLLVRERKFVCEVIVAVADKSAPKGDLDPDSPRWDLPDDMDRRDGKLLREFIDLKLRQENKRLAGLQKSKSAHQTAIEKSEQRIEYFRRYLNDQI